jgi:hypothetical protein
VTKFPHHSAVTCASAHKLGRPVGTWSTVRHQTEEPGRISGPFFLLEIRAWRQGNAEQVPRAAHPGGGRSASLQILAIAAAMAVVCASHPIPRPGVRHHGNRFSVAKGRGSRCCEGRTGATVRRVRGWRRQTACAKGWIDVGFRSPSCKLGRVAADSRVWHGFGSVAGCTAARPLDRSAADGRVGFVSGKTLVPAEVGSPIISSRRPASPRVPRRVGRRGGTVRLFALCPSPLV